MKYLRLAYYHEKKFDTLSKPELDAIVSECQPHDEALRKSGHLLAVASLQHRTATTLRPRNGKTSVIDGPFAKTKEQIGAFLIVEAKELNEAIHGRPADRARQGEDPRRAHSVCGAVGDGSARPTGRRAPGGLPRVQRGVFRLIRGSLPRPDLSGEAIRLGRLLVELLPEPEAVGLLALMLLHDSRRAARTSPTGELILLDDQDRSLWNRDQIAEGLTLVERALSSRWCGPYTLQAAIAAAHAEVPNAAATGWARIVGLDDVLVQADPSPVVELNRAVAMAMRDGPLAGLECIDAILARGDLGHYHLAHAARADLCRRLGRTAEARASYERALGLTKQAPERRCLERRLAELSDTTA